MQDSSATRKLAPNKKPVFIGRCFASFDQPGGPVTT
jgi:hypothetical protein